MGQPALSVEPPEVRGGKASAVCDHRARRILALRDAVIVIGVDGV